MNDEKLNMNFDTPEGFKTAKGALSSSLSSAANVLEEYFEPHMKRSGSVMIDGKKINCDDFGPKKKAKRSDQRLVDILKGAAAATFTATDADGFRESFKGNRDAGSSKRGAAMLAIKLIEFIKDNDPTLLEGSDDDKAGTLSCKGLEALLVKFRLGIAGMHHYLENVDGQQAPYLKSDPKLGGKHSVARHMAQTMRRILEEKIKGIEKAEGEEATHWQETITLPSVDEINAALRGFDPKIEGESPGGGGPGSL